MSTKRIFLLLIAFYLVLLPLQGCKKSSGTGSTATTGKSTTDANSAGEQAKQKISQAVEASGAYLAEQKDAAVKKAEQNARPFFGISEVTKFFCVPFPLSLFFFRFA